MLEAQYSNLIVLLLGVLKAAAIGGVGGLVAIVLRGQRPQANLFFSSMIVSGFSAWLMSKYAAHMAMSSDETDLYMGVAALGGPAFLRAVMKLVSKKFNLDLDIDFDPKKDEE